MLPPPYGKCAEDGEQQLKYFEGNYTKSKCLIECERDFMVRKCGCRMYYMPGKKCTSSIITLLGMILRVVKSTISLHRKRLKY